MSEWRLFPAGTVPDFTTPEFFTLHPWVPPEHQRGHAERTAMVAKLIQELVADSPPKGVVDLGCGDGSLLRAIAHMGVPVWGYDAGVANVARAAEFDTDVRFADIRTDPVEYGELIVASEVVEHLADPHEFVASLPGRRIVLSSPSAETDRWHYVHHAWAWDLNGYRELVEGAGWEVVEHRECDGGMNCHGTWGPQRFQVIAAVRA